MHQIASSAYILDHLSNHTSTLYSIILHQREKPRHAINNANIIEINIKCNWYV